jgi:hypothetical protein
MDIENIHKNFNPTQYIQPAQVQKIEWIGFIFLETLEVRLDTIIDQNLTHCIHTHPYL